ncbi:MAG: lytic transglycosylase domain-containing protein [Elusimicrobiota bacterium]|jgi:hypothetical protein
MKAPALLICGWLLLAASQGASAQAIAPEAQGVEAQRASLLQSIGKWKLLVPEGKDNEVRNAFLPDLERIETETRKPGSDLKDLEKQFLMWKNFFLSEMQAMKGFKDSKAFVEMEQERMRALLGVSQLATEKGSAGIERVSFWKSRISEVRDAATMRQLFDNMRVVENLAGPAFPAYARSSDAGTVYTGNSYSIRPEQAGTPPSPIADIGIGTFAAIKDFLLARGASPGVIGQTIQTVWDEVKRYSLDPTLVLSVILQESRYDPNAKSYVGAKGLMQIMPGTGRDLGLRSTSDFYDPVKNVKAGIRYLAEMMERFNGNVKMALAAYNAGPGAVEKYNGVPPYKETKGYVAKIYATYQQLYNLVFN